MKVCIPYDPFRDFAHVSGEIDFSFGLRAEVAKWTKLVREAGLKLD